MNARQAPRHDFDLRTEEFAKNPLPTYRLLLAEFPVCRIADGTYVVSRYDDVKFILKRHDLFGSGWTNPLFGSPEWLPDKYKRDSFLSEVDPPEHTQHNAIINKSFVTGEINKLTPFIQATAESLAAEIRYKNGKVDFLTSFAYPLAVKSITSIIGLDPNVDVDRIRKWITVMESIPLEHPGSTRQQEIEMMFLDQVEFYDEVILSRQAAPRGDLASAIVNAKIDGRALTKKQIRSALNLLLVAGIEAPAQTLARAIILLSQREDLVNLLHGNPEQIPAFIEELIRLGTPAQGSLRTSKAEVCLHEITIPPNSKILALTGAANRDPSQFLNPDAFQLSRPNIKSHMGFGQGVHVCIGAALARMQLKMGLKVLLNSFRHFDCPTTKELNWYSLVIAHLLQSLPVQFR